MIIFAFPPPLFLLLDDLVLVNDLVSILQWIDCVSQLLRMYPFAFEFSSVCVLAYVTLSCHEHLTVLMSILFSSPFYFVF
jgi:hypothetical protein